MAKHAGRSYGMSFKQWRATPGHDPMVPAKALNILLHEQLSIGARMTYLLDALIDGGIFGTSKEHPPTLEMYGDVLDTNANVIERWFAELEHAGFAHIREADDKSGRFYEAIIPLPRPPQLERSQSNMGTKGERLFRHRATMYDSEGEVTRGEWRDVLERFHGLCLACGTTEDIVADHVIPLSRGGTNTADNLQPLCWDCNARKGVQDTDYRPRRMGTAAQTDEDE